MVQSKINTDINYTESEKINDIDKGTSISFYKYFLYDMYLGISLGKIQKKHIDENIIFVPLYLWLDGKTVKKIGLFEFKQNKYADLLDDEGELDITLLDDMLLLFSFVNEKYLTKKLKNSTFIQDISDDDTSMENDDDILDEAEDDIINDDTELTPIEKPFSVEFDDNIEYKGETKNMNARIEKKYKKSDVWVSNYFKNNNYGLIDNEGCGDCFFATIRDAFKTMGINIQVVKIRTMLSDDTKQEDFDNYKDNFNMYTKNLTHNVGLVNTYKTLIKRRKLLASRYKKYKESIGYKEDVVEKISITNKAKKIKKEYGEVTAEIKKIGDIQEIKRDLIFAKEEYNNVKFMKNVKNLGEFKEILKTQDYWADSWSIQKIELLLNIKIIVLSSLKYKNGDYENILSCNSFTPTVIEKKGVFNPKYYILVDHTGEHYKLITYKDRRIFRFHELPYKLTQLIITKCMMSKGKTMYNYIPKFSKEIGIEIKINATEEEYEVENDEDEVENDEDEVEKEVEKEVKNEEEDEVEKEVEKEVENEEEDEVDTDEDMMGMGIGDLSY